MPKYTPGPWSWVIEGGDIEIRMGDAIESPYNCLAHNSFKYVDMIETYKKEQKEQAIANADLMTAAPELLQKLEKAKERIESMNDLILNTLKVPVDKLPVDDLEEVIKKAKGVDINE